MAARRLLALATCAAAASVNVHQQHRRDDPPNVLSFPVIQEERVQNLHSLRRRAVDTDVPILNVSSTSYLIELGIGTPAQSVRVAIDTGSSELWVNPNCDSAGTRSQQNSCIRNGHYDPSTSSSSTVSREQGRVKYGKGEVIFQYILDDIALPGSTVDLSNVQFGAATDSQDLNMGILGLSFGDNFNLDYPNFNDELVAQNVTQTRAFGVALGAKSEASNAGLITFGGVDTRKFSGPLHTSPMLGPQNRERLYRYWVTLDSMSLNGRIYAGTSFPVFFDTGATLSYLPDTVVQKLASDLGGFRDSSSGYFIVPCGQKGSIGFQFGDMTINVSLDEFIWDVNLPQNQCVLGADIGDDGSYLLGDSFLRSAYVVFDTESPALHFAQYVNCGTNLQAIPAGRNAAANFTGECNVSASSQNAAPARAAGAFGAGMAAAAAAAVVGAVMVM